MKRFTLLAVLALTGAAAARLPAQEITLLAGGDINWSRTLKPRPAFFDRDSLKKGEWPLVPFLNTPEDIAYLRAMGVQPDTTLRRDRRNVEYKLSFTSDEEEQRYPLQKLAPLMQSADVTFVNFENPAAEGGRWTGAFKASPTLPDALRWAGIDVVSVANNHAFDDSEEGLLETTRNLWRAGVGYVGGGRNLEDARRPFVLDRKGIKIAFLGYTQFVNGGPSSFATAEDPGVVPLDPRIIKEDIARVRKDVDYVIVSFHWGTENHQETEQGQRDFAHQIIDAGADVILGHHPHVPRGVEVYNGKVIVYSFGNLIFGHSHAYWMDNYLARFTMNRKEIKQVELIPIAGRMETLSQPYVLTGDPAKALLTDIQKRSAELDTKLDIKGDVGVLKPSSAAMKRVAADGGQ